MKPMKVWWLRISIRDASLQWSEEDAKEVTTQLTIVILYLA